MRACCRWNFDFFSDFFSRLADFFSVIKFKGLNLITDLPKLAAWFTKGRRFLLHRRFPGLWALTLCENYAFFLSGLVHAFVHSILKIVTPCIAGVTKIWLGLFTILLLRIGISKCINSRADTSFLPLYDTKPNKLFWVDVIYSVHKTENSSQAYGWHIFDRQFLQNWNDTVSFAVLDIRLQHHISKASTVRLLLLF